MADTDAPAAAKKAPAKKAPAKKTAPAAALAKGGGPENPVADVKAAKAAAGQLRERRQAQAEVRAQRREQRATVAFNQRQQDRAQRGGDTPGAPRAPRVQKAVGWAWSGNRKVLTGQFLVCLIVLFLGTLTAPPGSKDDVHRAMVKGSALSGLFLVLALLSAGDSKGSAAKAATALGTLVTAAYVFTSSDVRNVTGWVAGFFGQGGPAWQAGTGSSGGGPTEAQANDAAGQVGAGVAGIANEVGGMFPQPQSWQGTNEGTVDNGQYTSTTGFGY